MIAPVVGTAGALGGDVHMTIRASREVRLSTVAPVCLNFVALVPNARVALSGRAVRSAGTGPAPLRPLAPQSRAIAGSSFSAVSSDPTDRADGPCRTSQ